jgi:hypothetical protein
MMERLRFVTCVTDLNKRNDNDDDDDDDVDDDNNGKMRGLFRALYWRKGMEAIMACIKTKSKHIVGKTN